MSTVARQYRYYLSCVPTPDLIKAYEEDVRKHGNNAGREADRRVGRYITKQLKAKLQRKEFTVTGRPSSVDKARTDDEPLLISLLLSNENAVEAIAEAVHSIENTHYIRGGGSDVPLGLAEHWCPREALCPIFSDRSEALRLMRLDHNGLRHLSGRGVNVLIIDQGLDRNQIENVWGARYGGGWDVAGVQHGTVASPHGMMMARNILAVAPEATLYDLPLVPERITDFPTYLSTAHGVLSAIRAEIPHTGPWVFVNAWSIFDRRLDFPTDPYCQGGDHLFFGLISELAADGHDLVFCAGNCGQFCPDGRCGPTTIGPGHSIVGANSHSNVLTVGAVRTDGLWLGYSSQGPGQAGLSTDKPDLCGPSHFRDGDDASTVNTGTSAASALVAGVIAALRERWGSGVVLPEQMFQILRDTAHSGLPGQWEHRLGRGIIDASAAYAELDSRFPIGPP